MANVKKKSYFSISEITNEFNVNKRIIRACEDKKLITPRITKLNQRLYSEYDRARLKVILYCEATGYSLDQVADLIGIPDAALGEIERFRQGLEYGEKKLDELIKRSEELDFHKRTSILTDVNLLREDVKVSDDLISRVVEQAESARGGVRPRFIRFRKPAWLGAAAAVLLVGFILLANHLIEEQPQEPKVARDNKPAVEEKIKSDKLGERVRATGPAEKIDVSSKPSFRFARIETEGSE